MEPATAGVLYAAENLLQGAAALVKGVTHPTLPIKVLLTHITSAPLLRAHHSISVVKGRAYIFGGELQPGQLADNDMHVVILPSSGVQEADYTTFPARASNGFSEVPSPRRGHTAAVIGDSIYIFGGEIEGGNHDEKGRVWVYRTTSNTWSYLEPASDKLIPCARVGHGSASSDLPGPKSTTYREKAPQAPTDLANVVPEPAEADSWGTIFVVGGRETSTRNLLDDVLAFDVKSRTWSSIPSTSAQPRDGASVALVGDNLYRFGGFGGTGTEMAASDASGLLNVSHVWKHAEGGTTPLASGWNWQAVSHIDNKSRKTANPSARAHAGAIGVTTGQGRHYLLVVGGKAGNTDFPDDIWSLQLPPEHSTAAATKDKIRASIKRDTHELQWAEVLYDHGDVDEKEVEHVSARPAKGVGPRAHFGITKGTEVDGATAVVWGGLDAQGAILGDGWMITVDR